MMASKKVHRELRAETREVMRRLRVANEGLRAEGERLKNALGAARAAAQDLRPQLASAIGAGTILMGQVRVLVSEKAVLASANGALEEALEVALEVQRVASRVAPDLVLAQNALRQRGVRIEELETRIECLSREVTRLRGAGEGDGDLPTEGTEGEGNDCSTAVSAVA